MELVTYRQSSAWSSQIARILFGKCVHPWYTWLCFIATDWEALCSSDVTHVILYHFKENFFSDSLFQIDHCLPSFCLVISTILSKYNTVIFLLYLITLTLHQCLFVRKNFRQISRTLFASKLPAMRPLKESAEEKFMKLIVQNLCLSWSPV
jgi:hypothetical protein